jgi:hypothetical protein
MISKVVKPLSFLKGTQKINDECEKMTAAGKLFISNYLGRRGPRGSEEKLHERYYSLSFPNINLAF